MRQKVGRAVEAFAAAAGDGLAKMLCVPVDDDRGEQIEALSLIHISEPTRPY